MHLLCIPISNAKSYMKPCYRKQSLNEEVNKPQNASSLWTLPSPLIPNRGQLSLTPTLIYDTHDIRSLRQIGKHGNSPYLLRWVPFPKGVNFYNIFHSQIHPWIPYLKDHRIKFEESLKDICLPLFNHKQPLRDKW